ncbi:MAG: methyl-accepting chemotaxis protein [Erythrobacter sp.]
MNPQVAELRRRGTALLAVGSWIAVLVLIGLTIQSSAHALPALILAVPLSAVPTYALLKSRSDGAMRAAIGVVAALLPSLLLYAAQGNVWQLDLHLYFLVSLTLLVGLCDPRPIVLACLVGAFHHALMGLVAPHWVFFGGAGLWRVLLHFGAFAVSAVVLCALASVLRDAHLRIGELEDRADGLDRQLRDGSTALMEARAEVEVERERSARARDEMVSARKEAFETFATEFEESVSTITHSVAGTAQLLEQSAHALKLIADAAGDEVRDVVGAAETASKATNLVAAGVAELSMSIAEIAINVSQQSELTDHATERSDGGGKAIGTLTLQSRTIGEATRAIVRIAERTNLLSLNAAIEAASAGTSGRGFSIVANEVKVLASQASNAAVEIETFLKGVHSGTLEAERSFRAIDEAISELGKTATSIRFDVENQRQSADTIESFARGAASDTDAMVGQIKALADRAGAAKRLSNQLDRAAARLAESARKLEASTESFTSRLRTA